MINTHNPWKGLVSYEESDLTIYKFCGREKSISEMVRLVKTNLFVTLYGRTGIGKTSLLKAGVLPRLRSEGFLPIIVRFNDMADNDTSSMAEYIISKIERVVPEIRVNKYDKATDNEVDTLWEYFATRHFYDTDANEVFPVIVVDQFEENFLRPEHRVKAWDLMRQFYSLTDDNKAFPEGYHNETNFRIVVSIREDDLFRLEDCIDTLGLSEYKYNRYRLVQLTESEANDIICIPGNDAMPSDQERRACIAGRIINMVRDGNDNLSTLMLSLVCSQLYLKAQTTVDGIITEELTEGLNQNFLEEFYLGIVRSIPQEERYFIEDNLVDSHGRRNSVNREIMMEGCPSLPLLSDGANRILQESNGRVELVHDMLSKVVYEIRERRLEQQRVRELELRQQAERRKNRNRMLSMLSLVILTLGVAILFGYQYMRISQGQSALEKAHTDLLFRDRQINDANADLKDANRKLEEKSQSLENARSALQQGMEELVRSNFQIEYANSQLRTERERQLANQSRAAAAKAIDLVNQGDSYTARLVALEALPVNLDAPNRPYTAEAEMALRKAMSRNSAILRGHNAETSCCAISPDGTIIASGGTDGRIMLWDAHSGEILRQIDGGKEEIKKCVFNKSGDKLLTMSLVEIRQWDVATGQESGMPIHSDPDAKPFDNIYENVYYSDDIIALTSKSVRVYDAVTGVSKGPSISLVDDQSKMIYDSSLSPDGKSLAVVIDGKITIFDSKTWQPTATKSESGIRLGSVSYSPDGKYITAISNNRVYIWAANALGDNAQIVYSKERFSDLKSVNFTGAEISPDGNYIVMADSGGEIEVRSLKGSVLDYPKLRVDNGEIKNLTFSPDGDKILFTTDRQVKIWDWNAEYEKMLNLATVPIHHLSTKGICHAVTFSPDGKYLLIGGDNTKDAAESLFVWDYQKDRVVKSLSCTGDMILHIICSDDGRLMLTVTKDGQVDVWDLKTWTKTGISQKYHSYDQYQVKPTFMPDKKALVVDEDVICVLDPQTGKDMGRIDDLSIKLVRDMKKWMGPFKCIALHPDGNLIATVSVIDNTLRIWDLKRRQLVDIYSGLGNYIMTMTYSPDGRYLVMGAHGGNVTVHDTSQGYREVSQLKKFNGVVWDLAFSNDNKYLAACSSDGEVSIMDFESGLEMQSYKCQGIPRIYSIAFSPDDRWIAAAADGGAAVWEFKPLAELMDQVRLQLKNRKLSQEEQRLYYLMK